MGDVCGRNSQVRDEGTHQIPNRHNVPHLQSKPRRPLLTRSNSDSALAVLRDIQSQQSPLPAFARHEPTSPPSFAEPHYTLQNIDLLDHYYDMDNEQDIEVLPSGDKEIEEGLVIKIESKDKKRTAPAATAKAPVVQVVLREPTQEERVSGDRCRYNRYLTSPQRAPRQGGICRTTWACCQCGYVIKSGKWSICQNSSQAPFKKWYAGVRIEEAQCRHERCNKCVPKDKAIWQDCQHITLRRWPADGLMEDEKEIQAKFGRQLSKRAAYFDLRDIIKAKGNARAVERDPVTGMRVGPWPGGF